MAREVKTKIILSVSGKEVENSFSALYKETKKTTDELKKLVPGTEAFIKKSKELKEVKEKFNELNEEIQNAHKTISGLEGTNLGRFLYEAKENFKEAFSPKNIANNFTGLLSSKISQTADELLKVADAMADVQKTTGMAQDEVKNLWDAFDEMDTRTSKLDRLKIAEEAGRLGVPKEQMREFVQEIDKVNVALGDSYKGGLQQIVGDIGKMKSLFEETKGKTYALAINEIGSALNELAANGTASEANIADFTLRVGALPDALKPSIDKVMGLGAAFEESGVDSQIAASGYSNFMKVAGENLEAFAYSMNISVAEARQLFNEKPEEFFLRFSEGMRNVPADETAKIFDSLKLNSLEVQKAVGAAANNTDVFSAAMTRAGQEMEKANSITNEFNTKNENAAAIWDKVKNVVADTFTSTTMQEWFEGGIRLIGWFTGVTKEAGNGVLVFKERIEFLGKLILVTATAFVSYRTAIALTAMATGELSKQTLLYTAVQKAQELGNKIRLFFSLAASIRSTKDAMALLNLVTKANPWMLLASVVTTAVVVFKAFNTEANNATKIRQQLNEVQQEAVKTSAKEISELDRLYKAATDASKGKDAQRRAVEQLQQLYPGYFGNLSHEIIMTGKAAGEYNKLRTAILNAARARAAQKVIDENAEKYLDRELKIKQEKEEILEDVKAASQNAKKNGGKYVIEEGGNYVSLDRTQYLNYQKNRYRSLSNQEKELNATREKEMKPFLDIVEQGSKNAPVSNDNSGGNRAYGSNSGKKGSGGIKTNRPAPKDTSSQDLIKAKDTYQKALEQRASEGKKMQDLERALEDERLKIKEESREKAEEEENLRHQRAIQDIQARNKDIQNEINKNKNEIEKLQNERNKTQSPQAQKEYDAAIAELQKINQSKEELIKKSNEVEKAMEETHLYNLQEIKEDYALRDHQKEMERKARKLEKQKAINEEEINNIKSFEEAKAALKEMEYLKLTEKELSEIQTLEDAKKALRENLNREALQKQYEFLDAQQKALEKIINETGFSDEEKTKLLEDLEELRQKMIAVKGEIIGNENEDAGKAEKEGREAMKQIDLLGFSANDWEQMFKNLDTTEGKMQAVKMGVQALSNAFSMFSQLQQNLGQRELSRFTRNQEKKKLALLKQLNQGLITQEQYHKGLQTLEEETDNKKREIARKQAKAQRIQAIAQIAVNTAQAIMSIWAQVPKFDFGISAGVLTGVVAALGAAQAAIVLSQPLPEFAEGGFTGKGSGNADRTGFRPAGIVHESEYVTPKWMLENPVVADVVDWMESIRTGRTALPQAYAEGGFSSMKNEELRMNNDKQTTENPSSEINYQLSQTLSEVRDLLSDLKENGVDAFMIEDAENGKRLKRTIKMFEKLEQKNARK